VVRVRVTRVSCANRTREDFSAGAEERKEQGEDEAKSKQTAAHRDSRQYEARTKP